MKDRPFGREVIRSKDHEVKICIYANPLGTVYYFLEDKFASQR